ncbi:MAG TPA: hypothetical protein VM737_10600 [Gemmatimonadota bacterium]|nr:hypothetical protein [Gemmatimonadota bacterium]
MRLHLAIPLGLTLTFGASLFGAGPFGAIPLVAQQGPVTAVPHMDLFPLEVGTVWIYEGTIWWTPDRSWAIYEERVTWTMEVTGRIAHPGAQAVTLKGHPRDLARWVRGREPGRYLLVELEGRYYLLEGERAAGAERRLRNRADDLAGLLGEADLVLDPPLDPGRRFCAPEGSDGAARTYCWGVEDETPADLRNVFGGANPATADSARGRTLYTLSLGAGDEHHVWGFVPGFGLASYAFGHTGTVSAVEVELVEIRRPEL